MSHSYRGGPREDWSKMVQGIDIEKDADPTLDASGPTRPRLSRRRDGTGAEPNLIPRVEYERRK